MKEREKAANKVAKDAEAALAKAKEAAKEAAAQPAPEPQLPKDQVCLLSALLPSF